MIHLKIRVPDIAQVDVTISNKLVGEGDEYRQVVIFARPDDDLKFPPINKDNGWIPLIEGQEFTTD